mmetsp:Transcript_20125/g.49334  ORF Transcript_20125/g.49334 Transcript_20125/m.49334 type:complete len:220 (+) Transcript_20125:821-1480(+)
MHRRGGDHERPHPSAGRGDACDLAVRRDQGRDEGPRGRQDERRPGLLNRQRRRVAGREDHRVRGLHPRRQGERGGLDEGLHRLSDLLGIGRRMVCSAPKPERKPFEEEGAHRLAASLANVHGDVPAAPGPVPGSRAQAQGQGAYVPPREGARRAHRPGRRPQDQGGLLHPRRRVRRGLAEARAVCAARRGHPRDIPHPERPERGPHADRGTGGQIPGCF